MEWITKKKDCGSESDVSITLTKCKDKLSRVNITLRNGCHKRITTTGYVAVGVMSNRLYFKETDSRTGYKVVEKTDSNTRYLAIVNDKLAEWIKDKIGDYKLFYDSNENLYYIEKPYIAWTEKGFNF